jgi:alpha,alpha-trehalase
MLNYGIIGNCKTCALINKNSGVDWFCFPDFDSPSVFAKILDNKKGGEFRFYPDKNCKITQKYIDNTNIIETIFTCDDYSFKIIDFFPRYHTLLPKNKKKMFKQNYLLRLIEPIKGKPKIKVIFNPKLDYARGETIIEDKEDFLLVKNDKLEMHFRTNLDFNYILKEEFFELNQRKFFSFGIGDEKYNLKKCLDNFRWTKKYWEKWVSTLTLPEQNKELIIRSALTLKLLTYSETGAILAASTTSIPEEIGSVRTWDYRYCWIRDAAHCADAFKKIGREYEAKKLMEFIIKCGIRDDFVQPLYTIKGETNIKEEILEHLEGYYESRPVRVGNAAFFQMQNDIYGEIIDIMYLYFAYYEYEKKMTNKYWRFLRYLVNQIKFNWRKKDSGIWEFRDIYQHYTFSKFMCYLGVDRAIKLAHHFEKKELVNEWLSLREEIRMEILEKGYNTKKETFTIHYDSNCLDAAILLMAYHEFLESTDPRMINTIKAIYETLMQEGYLVQRYNMTDDFGKAKTAFTICSFWLVDALAYIDQKEKAKEIFSKLLKRSNHMGLFSEDIDIETKNLTGNFPQAYTHIAIINTSILLSEWSTRRIKIKNNPKNKWI